MSAANWFIAVGLFAVAAAGGGIAYRHEESKVALSCPAPVVMPPAVSVAAPTVNVAAPAQAPAPASAPAPAREEPAKPVKKKKVVKKKPTARVQLKQWER